MRGKAETRIKIGTKLTGTIGGKKMTWWISDPADVQATIEALGMKNCKTSPIYKEEPVVK